jgi:hypothetical protein
MATSQTTPTPGRRPPGDPAHPGAAPPERDVDPGNPHANTPGHPQARGTLPMARHLTDLAIEDEIQALAAEAPPMTVDQAARLARLLRINRPHRDRAA